MDTTDSVLVAAARETFKGTYFVFVHHFLVYNWRKKKEGGRREGGWKGNEGVEEGERGSERIGGEVAEFRFLWAKWWN